MEENETGNKRKLEPYSKLRTSFYHKQKDDKLAADLSL